MGQIANQMALELLFKAKEMLKERKEEKSLKNRQNDIVIRMLRDSVCMGDDCTAPNAQEILFEASTTLEDLMYRTAKYVPAMRNYKWKVMCGAEVLGTLVSGEDAVYQVTLFKKNVSIQALAEREIFCRKE